MKIFFTASYGEKANLQHVYDKIVSVLKEKNVEIISREVLKYDEFLDEKIMSGKSDEELHYLFVRKAALEADGVIIEASSDSFQLGHESGLALVYNKPVLCLSKKWDYSRKIRHPVFYAKEYHSDEEIENYVTEFIKTVDNLQYSVRFNMRLSPAQKNFLDLLGRKTNKNASEIVRELIQKEMTENTNISDLL